MKIIGLSGKMGCGKNYIAEKILYPYFKNSLNILIIGFGDLMKNELYARDLTISYDQLYDHKTFETRQKLQQYGTENGRDKYHQDIWIRGLDIQIETFKRRSGENSLVIICDVRFINEYHYIKEKGGKIIRIEAPNRTKLRYSKEASLDEKQMKIIMNHRSETELDNIVFDIYLKNDFDDKFNEEILNDL
jgi:phosphomevalonate kinase